MFLLTDEEIIDAIGLNPNKSHWSEKDWDAQITREIRWVAKAQLKKVIKELRADAAVMLDSAKEAAYSGNQMSEAYRRMGQSSQAWSLVADYLEEANQTPPTDHHQ